MQYHQLMRFNPLEGADLMLCWENGNFGEALIRHITLCSMRINKKML